mmetsp:Transcript_15588/g.17610  ORF Transcript_15588/g.17610 Transcript_15588/m.17610 type:complete len:239 (+) Transcript_15588:493-1209(+)
MNASYGKTTFSGAKRSSVHTSSEISVWILIVQSSSLAKSSYKAFLPVPISFWTQHEERTNTSARRRIVMYLLRSFAGLFRLPSLSLFYRKSNHPSQDLFAKGKEDMTQSRFHQGENEEVAAYEEYAKHLEAEVERLSTKVMLLERQLYRSQYQFHETMVANKFSFDQVDCDENDTCASWSSSSASVSTATMSRNSAGQNENYLVSRPLNSQSENTNMNNLIWAFGPHREKLVDNVNKP